MTRPPLDVSPPDGTPVYVAHGKVVFHTIKGQSGRTLITVAKSNTYARRIAAALNWHKPNEKGV